MVRKDPRFGFALCLAGICPLASAGDDPLERPISKPAPLEIPHAMNLELDHKARKRSRRPGNIESIALLDVSPALTPVVWPRASDMRSRIVTPELRKTPVVGWIAANLYRSKKDNGWCLEVDPGEGEYVVFYRLNMK